MSEKERIKKIGILILLTLLIFAFLIVKTSLNKKKISAEIKSLELEKSKIQKRTKISKIDLMKWEKTIKDLKTLKKYIYKESELPVLRFEIEKIIADSGIFVMNERVSIVKSSKNFGELLVTIKGSISDIKFFSLSENIRHFPKLIYIKKVSTDTTANTTITIGGVYEIQKND